MCPLEVAHLLAHPDWANNLFLLDWLSRQSSLSTCCKCVLQLIHRHHCEWNVSPSYLLDISLGTSTPSTPFLLNH